jgi:hypothetical protein
MTRTENAELLSTLFNKTQNILSSSPKKPNQLLEHASTTRYMLRNHRSSVDYTESDFVYADDKKDANYEPFVFQRPKVSEPADSNLNNLNPIPSEPIQFQIIEPSDSVIQSFLLYVAT